MIKLCCGKAMGLFASKNEFPVDGRTVLITGGSKGLGLNSAFQLAEKGANIIIVARDTGNLRNAMTEISKRARDGDTQRFHSITADVTTPVECKRVVDEATKWNGTPPDIVWCCSGSAHPTLFVDTPLDQFQSMMDSNYFSSVYMAHAILNAWFLSAATGTNENLQSESLQQGKVVRPAARHIIFTGSFVSFYSFAGFTPYSPSKAAVRSLSDSLSQEMNLYAAAYPDLPRVRVHTVFPATMPTQSLEDENAVKTDLTKSLEEGDQVLQPHECARRAIRGLESGEELVPTSTIIRLVMTSVMGGSIRGGFWKGLVNTILGAITLVVMIFIRWDMDSKVQKWGKQHGASGASHQKKE
ncbi:NAD(P)-binding protein [Xylariaceae sp. FL1272]|nr:NAD(P)-binding protein [Xylariaceae sp. FL1272]